MADENKTPFDQLCLDAIQSIGKTLSQMNLYNSKHPAVRAMIADSGGLLARALEGAPEGKLVYSLDREKLIANGRIVGQAGQLPSSIPQIFTRFKLNSLSFAAGVSEAEIAALCELAALRPEAAKGVVASDFLRERGVAGITLNEAVYAKVEAVSEEDRPVQLSGEMAAKFAESVKDEPLEAIVHKLVESLVPDPADRERIIRAVLERIQSELEKAVKDATRELRHEKTVVVNEAARAGAVMGTMADGVVTVDDKGQVLTMNPEAEGLLGGRMSEMIGKGLPELIKDEHLLSMAKSVGKPSGEKEEEGAVDASDKAGAGRTLRASTVLVRNEEGKPVGMVSALTDAAKHRELEKREREFVAHVTHELRSPLAAIIAALELLDMEAAEHLKGSAGKLMENARRNADRLEGLINSILDFSKIEAGQMTVVPKPCEAEQIARDGVESLQPWAHKKGLQLRLDAEKGLSSVLADHSRSVQVIVNLISNAIKFSPKGETILVRVRAEREGDGLIRFGVKDNGPGIAKEQQHRVFQKFQQVHDGGVNVGGTGLGLAIAKSLVEMQKGKLWFESEAGRGTEFLFTLPRYASPDGEEAPPKAEEVQAPWWKRLFGLK